MEMQPEHSRLISQPHKSSLAYYIRSGRAAKASILKLPSSVGRSWLPSSGISIGDYRGLNLLIRTKVLFNMDKGT
jgi:hypothetical protein